MGVQEAAAALLQTMLSSLARHRPDLGLVPPLAPDPGAILSAAHNHSQKSRFRLTATDCGWKHLRYSTAMPVCTATTNHAPLVKFLLVLGLFAQFVHFAVHSCTGEAAASGPILLNVSGPLQPGVLPLDAAGFATAARAFLQAALAGVVEAVRRTVMPTSLSTQTQVRL